MIDEEDNTTEVVDDDAAQIEGEHHEQEQQETQDDIESRARRMGWVDEENFRGPRHKWTSAEEYVRRAEEELPVLRAQLRKFEGDNARYEKTVGELKQEISQMGNDFKAFHEHYKNIEQQSYDRAIRDLKETQITAVEEADRETYEAAQRRIDEIERQKAAHAENARHQEAKQEQPQQQTNGQPQGQITPAAQQFMAENAWFQKSLKLQGAMIEHINEVVAEKPYLTEEELYDEAKQRVVQEFPKHFPGQQQQTTQEPRQNMRRNQAASVASPNGSTRTTPKKGKSFDDLPDDAKQEFQRFASRIPGYTKEEYVKSYRWS